MLEALLSTTKPPVSGPPASAVLMHFDGANGSQTFIEEHGQTITVNGMARHSNTQSKFGGTSLYVDGSFSFVKFPAVTLTADYTIECWFYQIANTNPYAPIISGTNGSYNFPLILNYPNATATGYFGQYLSGGTASTYVGSLYSLNTWNHIAMVRTGIGYAGYINGARALYLPTSGIVDVTVDTIGGWAGGSGFQMNGYIDEVRICKAAVYDWTKSTIDVPTAPFTV